MMKSKKSSSSSGSGKQNEVASRPSDTTSSDRTDDEQIEFASGANRDDAARNVAFHLLCPSALREYARTAKVGELHYGARNWEKGIPTENYIDHALDHLLGSMELKGKENAEYRLIELSHALWNIAAAIHNETGCEHHDWKD